MYDADLPMVHAIECAAYSHPWNLEIFKDCLRVGYYSLIGEVNQTAIGYGIMSVAVGECHIFNLCIHPHWQRRGWGRLLLQHLLSIARKRGAETAFLEVRASNQSARMLYAAEGFCEIGVRRDYYPTAKGRENAIVLALALIPIDFNY
ncbi:ribosomal-protein-alanine N-acetyltransferase [Chromatium weissei]|nr:ribosomal-protein-alanine N-acetyltransferase [Chromatium weissei]